MERNRSDMQRAMIRNEKQRWLLLLLLLVDTLAS